MDDSATPHKASMPLPALVPGALLPERYSARARVVTWLKRIDHVTVRETVRRDVGKRYVVEVFMKRSQNRIPSVQQRATDGWNAASRPDVTTEHRFSEFSQLLSDCYFLAEESHGFLPCTFCVGFVDYVLTGKDAPSRLHKIFHSDASVCELLTQFLNNLLQLTCRVKTYEDECSCLGKKQAPELMKRFLSAEDEDADEDSHSTGVARGA